MLQRSEGTSQKTEAQISEGWADCIRKGADVAMWRQPGNHAVHLLASFSRDLSLNERTLEVRPAGFIVAPFDCADYRTALYLKSDYYHVYNPLDPDAKSGPLPANPQTIVSAVAESEPGRTPSLAVQKKNFLILVNKAKRVVSEGFFEKLVPARTFNVELAPSFDAVQAFLKAEAKYLNAFVYLIYVKERGLWLGASPELLIERDVTKELFKTVALAGTQPISENKRVEELLWMQKEIEEQAMVSRFIVDRFKQIRLREFVETGPRAVRSGRAAHLMSEFKVEMKAGAYEDLASLMLNLLHPTSAVCGSPKDKAMAFLLENEPFDRQLYAGYLGPVNIGGMTQIHVNLRCARLFKKCALLFAGAGVTAGSDAEKEWAETELKFKTMQDILQ